jgi:hypothetical protein
MPTYNISKTQKDFHTFHTLSTISSLKNTFIAIGKATSWENDEYIPEPKDFIEPLIYKRVRRVSGIFPDICGSLMLEDKRWSYFSKDTPFKNIPDYPAVRDILIESEINWRDYTANSFRIIALFNNLELKKYVNPNQEVYIPDDVATSGLLLYIMNSQPIYRAEGKVHNFKIIL